MKIVILAEKPSQALAYAEAFEKYTKKKGYFEVSGNGFNNAIITFGYGHLVELYNPEDCKKDWKKWKMETLPILPSEFKVSKDKVTQYKIVKQHLDSADEIFPAHAGVILL